MNETEIKSINNRTLCDNTARQSIANLTSQLAALTAVSSANINDTTPSISTTYSSSKIEDLVDSIEGGSGVSSYNDLTDKPTIPSKTSQLQNDSGFLTAHQSLSAYAKKTDIPTVPTKTSQLTNDSGFLTSHQSLSGYAKTNDIPTKTSQLTNDSGFLTAHQDISGKADKTTVGTLSSLNTTAKTNLVAAINEVFQSASNGKSAIATAITGKGVSASSNDTWEQLAAKIGQITSETPIKGSINSSNSISLSGLSSGTYTLKYLDADGAALTDWNDIATMEVS